MLLAALLLVAAQTAAPPPSADAPPEDRAAALAGVTFGFGCLQRLGAVGSAAEFARGSDALGAQLARDYPAESASVRLDGDDGWGCRIRYTGPRADRLWTAYTGVLAGGPTPGRGGCTVSERGDARVLAACVDTGAKPSHRGELVMERSGSGATGSVTVALAWAPPAN